MAKSKIDTLEKKLIEKKRELAQIEEELLQARKRKKIPCLGNAFGPGCGKSFPMGKLTYIQTHWWKITDDGSYWAEGEGQFDCPECGHRNRLLQCEEYPPEAYNPEHYARVLNSISNRFDHLSGAGVE